jgi:hypothetical protein
MTITDLLMAIRYQVMDITKMLGIVFQRPMLYIGQNHLDYSLSFCYLPRFSIWHSKDFACLMALPI